MIEPIVQSRAASGQYQMPMNCGPVRSPPVGERVLTHRELNRALLARQLLLDRVRLPLPRVLERLGGIQNQYAPNGYIRLWSCVEGFERDDLTRALERRSVIQGTLMRETIHLVSRRDYPLFAAGIRQAGRDWRLRVDKRNDDREVAALARKLRAHLRGRTISRKELDAFVRGTPGVGHWVNMVRVPPAGTWEQRGAHTYGLAEEWVGSLEASEDDGIEHLVRRYLGGFGPARVDDIASWSGVPKRRFASVLEHMRLRRFRDEQDKELLDLPRAPLPDPETPAPVRFLPTWDATLLVHARRTGVLPEKYRPIVFSTKMPPSYPTFLVDGAVAGTWRYERGRVTIDPFRRLSRDARREVEEEAERLAAFHAD
jgi:Winged helix DNA-binding domain